MRSTNRQKHLLNSHPEFTQKEELEWYNQYDDDHHNTTTNRTINNLISRNRQQYLQDWHEVTLEENNNDIVHYLASNKCPSY